MKTTIRILVAVSAAVLWSGCAQADATTSIRLEYLSNGQSYRGSSFTYKLLPMKGGEFDLRLTKIGKEVKRVLKTSGLEESSAPDMIIFFDFGSGGIKEIEHSIPYAIRGQTGITSLRTTGTIFGNTINTKTTTTPQYGVIGQGEHKYTTYIDSYYLSLMAIDAKSLTQGEPKQLWTAILTSSGKLFDEDLSLKAMLTAIKDKIGTRRDSSYSLHMTKSQIINPPHEMGLDVDTVAERSKDYLTQMNKTIESRSPQPYSQENATQSLVKQVENWTVFCQRTDNTINGCGMTDTGITVFIDAKNHTPTVLVGVGEHLAPESQVCLETDDEAQCIEVERHTADRHPPTKKSFGESAFWKLENSKKVQVTYTPDKQNVHNLHSINMNHYHEALGVLRDSLP